MQGSKKAWIATALLVALAIAVALLTGCVTLTPQISYDFGRQRLDLSFVAQK